MVRALRRFRFDLTIDLTDSKTSRIDHRARQRKDPRRLQSYREALASAGAAARQCLCQAIWFWWPAFCVPLSFAAPGAWRRSARDGSKHSTAAVRDGESVGAAGQASSSPKRFHRRACGCELRGAALAAGAVCRGDQRDCGRNRPGCRPGGRPGRAGDCRTYRRQDSVACRQSRWNAVAGNAAGGAETGPAVSRQRERPDAHGRGRGNPGCRAVRPDAAVAMGSRRRAQHRASATDALQLRGQRPVPCGRISARPTASGDWRSNLLSMRCANSFRAPT